MKKDSTNILTSYFSQHDEVAAVYLFGSQARNDARLDSDIDLAVLFNTHTPKQSDLVLKFMSDLPDLLSAKVDICDIKYADVLFAYRVLCESKLIYRGNENKRIEFETKIMRNYFDLKPFFAEYYQTISNLARKGKINARPFTY